MHQVCKSEVPNQFAPSCLRNLGLLDYNAHDPSVVCAFACSYHWGCAGFDVYGLLVVVTLCTGAELLPRCDYELKHLGLQAFGPLMAPASSLLTGLLLPAVGGFPVPAGLAARSLSWPRRSPVCMVQLLRWCCLVCYSFTCFGTSVVVQSRLSTRKCVVA